MTSVKWRKSRKNTLSVAMINAPPMESSETIRVAGRTEVTRTLGLSSDRAAVSSPKLKNPSRLILARAHTLRKMKITWLVRNCLPTRPPFDANHSLKHTCYSNIPTCTGMMYRDMNATFLLANKCERRVNDTWILHTSISALLNICNVIPNCSLSI